MDYFVQFATFFLCLVASVYLISAAMTVYYTYSVWKAIDKFVGLRTLSMYLLTGPVGAIRICFGYLQLQMAIADYQQSLRQQSPTGGERIRMTTRPPGSRDSLN